MQGVFKISEELNWIVCEVKAGIEFTIFFHCELAPLEEVRVHEAAHGLDNGVTRVDIWFELSQESNEEEKYNWLN